jgi:type VI secretion system protein ImpG
MFMMLVDANEAPHAEDLNEVAVSALCTNRDLPLLMPVGGERPDFTMAAGAPVRSVRCLGTPTRPRPALAEEGTAWRLVSHLSLNYFSLIDHDEQLGAAALREMLSLYADPADLVVRKQIDGVKSVGGRPVFLPVANGGPIAFGRGLEVKVNFEEAAFRGRGVFLLGAVLEEMFARYISINSFTKTVIRTTDRGEIARWPARTGQRPIL